MTNSGPILWNAIAICENVQDLLADGKTPYERLFGEPLKGSIIPFGAMVEIIRFLLGTSQGSTNLVRKFDLEYSSDMHCMRGEFGKEISWSQTLRNWRVWTRQKFMVGDSLQKKY